MKDFATVPRPTRVRIRGQITIPQDLREEMNLDGRTVVNIFRVGKVLLMSPKGLQRASLTKQAERRVRREGPSLENLLADLRSQRKRYLEESCTKD